MRALVSALVAALALSCRSGPEPGADGTTPPPRSAVGTADPPPTRDAPGKLDPCGAAALGLAGAAPLTAWQPPTGCTPRGSGVQLVRSDVDLEARLECPAGAPAGLDFTRQAALSVEYTLSPAGAGLLAFDDGKVVTLVTRQRSPCPDDPMPMPMNVTTWFTLSTPGERSIANKICTVDSTCK